MLLTWTSTRFAIVVGTTGSYRGALASLLVLFALAAVLLSRVVPADGLEAAVTYDPDAVYVARRLALPDAQIPTPRGRTAYTAICRVLGLLVRPQAGGFLAAGPVLAVAGRRKGCQLRMLGTAGVFTAPLVGTVLLAAGMVPVKRRTVEASSSLAGARLLLEAGEAVALIPEGRIGTGPFPAPYRHGAARLALTTGAPVFLAALSGTADIVPPGTWKPRLDGWCSVVFAQVDLLGELGLSDPVTDPSAELVTLA